MIFDIPLSPPLLPLLRHALITHDYCHAFAADAAAACRYAAIAFITPCYMPRHIDTLRRLMAMPLRLRYAAACRQISLPMVTPPAAPPLFFHLLVVMMPAFRYVGYDAAYILLRHFASR